MWVEAITTDARMCSACTLTVSGEQLCRSCGCMSCGVVSDDNSALLTCTSCRETLLHKECLTAGSTCHRCTSVSKPVATSGCATPLDPFALLFSADPRQPLWLLVSRLAEVATGARGCDGTACDESHNPQRHGIGDLAGAAAVAEWRAPPLVDEDDRAVAAAIRGILDTVKPRRKAGAAVGKKRSAKESREEPAALFADGREAPHVHVSAFAARREQRIAANRARLAQL